MGLVSDNESPESLVLRLSDTSALKRCLELLEPTRRQAILLAYVHGVSHGELAGRMGSLPERWNPGSAARSSCCGIA